MKLLATLCLLLLLTACASNTSPEATPKIPTQLPSAGAIDARFRVECEQTVDPKVMLAALPGSYKDYTQVGDIISDKGGDKEVGFTSTALRTLTINDERYLTVSAHDACGFNLNKQTYSLWKVGTDEYGWTKAISVNGYPGIINYEEGTGFYTLQVLLRDRLLVQVNGDGASEAETVDIAGTIDIAAIEAAIA